MKQMVSNHHGSHSTREYVTARVLSEWPDAVRLSPYSGPHRPVHGVSVSTSLLKDAGINGARPRVFEVCSRLSTRE